MDPQLPTATTGEGVRPWLIVCLLCVLFLAVVGPKAQFSQWYIGPDNNQAAAEAMAWLDGHLDMTERGGDVALYNGKNYNLFPPLLTIICYVVYGLNQLIYGEPLVFPIWLFGLVVAGPVPILCYVAMRRTTTGTFWAAVLAFYLVAGTALVPVTGMLGAVRTAWIYSIQHLLAQTGMAIMLIDLLGARRFWLAGLGVLIAAWSRQPCYLYALPVLYLAWRSQQRWSALLRAGVPIAVAMAVTLGLNWAKFGSPFETGYRYIFAERENEGLDAYRGPDGSIEIVGWRYAPRHAYDMFVAPPDIYLSHQGLHLTGTGPRTALWYGSPLFVLALAWVRRWWKDPTRRALMLTTLPIILVALTWHGPTEGSPGYYRYTLDYALIWLAVIAPWTHEPRWRPLTVGCLCWSVFYFYMLPA